MLLYELPEMLPDATTKMLTCSADSASKSSFWLNQFVLSCKRNSTTTYRLV